MGPNNPNYSVPTAPQRPGIDRKFILIGIGAVVALIIGGVLFAFSSGPSQGDEYARAVARHDQLLLIATDGEKNIRSGDLRKINADAVLFIKTDIVALTSLMKKNGPQAVPQGIKDSEKAKNNIKELTDAISAGNYDEKFISKFSVKLEEQQAHLRKLYDSSNSKSAQQTLSGIYAKNEALLKQLSELKN